MHTPLFLSSVLQQFPFSLSSLPVDNDVEYLAVPLSSINTRKQIDRSPLDAYLSPY